MMHADVTRNCWQKDPDVEMVKETEIQDLRGGKREGAGRKAKHSKLIDSQTAVIRVPLSIFEAVKTLSDLVKEDVSYAERFEEFVKSCTQN